MEEVVISSDGEHHKWSTCTQIHHSAAIYHSIKNMEMVSLCFLFIQRDVINVFILSGLLISMQYNIKYNILMPLLKYKAKTD